MTTTTTNATLMTAYGVSAEDIWSEVFGACGTSWPWYRSVRFLAGAAWDRPGKVRVVMDGDDDEKPVTKVLTVDDVVTAYWEAVGTSVDTCTGASFAPVDGYIELDACSADCVIQTAVLGRVVFG